MVELNESRFVELEEQGSLISLPQELRELSETYSTMVEVPEDVREPDSLEPMKSTSQVLFDPNNGELMNPDSDVLPAPLEIVYHADGTWSAIPRQLELEFNKENDRLTVANLYRAQFLATGISLTLGRTNKKKQGDPRPLHSQILRCFYSRHRERSPSTNERTRDARDSGATAEGQALCPFQIKVTASLGRQKVGKYWRLEIKSLKHNHPRHTDISELAALRREQLIKLWPKIEPKINLSTPSQILLDLELDPDVAKPLYICPKNLYNIKSKVNRLRAEGESGLRRRRVLG